MKTFEQVRTLLKTSKKDLNQRYKVKRLGVFGSYARGQQRRGSDIDVLVEFKKGASLLDLSGVSIYLKEKLGEEIDVVSKNGLRKELRSRILSEVVPI
jgi:uncharacterized protein